MSIFLVGSGPDDAAFPDVFDRFAAEAPERAGGGPARVARAYERAKLFRASANRCLPRSLAMARRLASLRCDALLVIGVRAQPFAAHAWVQSGDIVLNETPDEVARYTPIYFA